MQLKIKNKEKLNICYDVTCVQAIIFKLSHYKHSDERCVPLLRGDCLRDRVFIF